MGMFLYYRGHGFFGFLYPILVLGAVLGDSYSDSYSAEFLEALAGGPVAFGVSKVSTGPFSAWGLRRVCGILFSAFGVATPGASFVVACAVF